MSMIQSIKAKRVFSITLKNLKDLIGKKLGCIKGPSVLEVT